MDSESGQNKSIFEQLQETTPASVSEREKRNLERAQHANEQAQRRLSDLVNDNATLPATIHNVAIHGAHHTRNSFLKRIFDPLLKHNTNRDSTLQEVLAEIALAAEKLRKHDIFHYPIDLYIDRSEPSDPTSSPTDFDVSISVKEKSRLTLKTGTEVGNAEGAAYINGSARNVFGGAESVNVYAGLGTRTRSQYQATFDSPILSNPDLRVEFGGSGSTTQKSYASHEEVLKEGWTRLRYLTPAGHNHALTYRNAWRQVTGLAQNASPSVRNDAGDSAKSSVEHTWRLDTRDNPLLPQRGFLIKSLSELAGWGVLGGDVAFAKAEIETQSTLPVPLPLFGRASSGDNGSFKSGYNATASGISFSTGFRAGLLYPLSLSSSSSPPSSRINDRFTLGGPSDIRGFRISGLGPRDGPDAVGGDIYAAASAKLLFPLPRLGPERPIRLQAFVNGGRLLALGQGRDVNKALQQMTEGWPSTAAGIGLVYAHPVARFELNFSVPLVLRQGEEGRKGLQFGIGVDMF